MPSYRPQANTSQSAVLHSCAVACVNGAPDGVGITRVGRARASEAATASSASPHGTGLMTMPGPPP